MLFVLVSTLLLVVGLPLAFFSLGHGQAYLDHGATISAILLLVFLVMTLINDRRRR